MKRINNKIIKKERRNSKREKLKREIGDEEQEWRGEEKQIKRKNS